MRGLATASQVIVGLVFLVAGAVKVWDPVSFFWSTAPLGRLLAGVLWDTVSRAALALGPLEVGLGLALIVGWRPRVILPMTFGLLVFFLVILITGWASGYTLECGCFGTLVQRTPGEAIVEDLLLLGLVSLAWWVESWEPKRTRAEQLIIPCLGLLVSVAIWSVQLADGREWLTRSGAQVGSYVGDLPFRDGRVDLTQGDVILKLFSPTCHHCQEAVPTLNRWKEAGLAVVALSQASPNGQELKKFRDWFGPKYTLGEIQQAAFLRMVGGQKLPRFLYLRDGVVLTVWKPQTVPTLEELQQLASEQPASEQPASEQPASEQPASEPKPSSVSRSSHEKKPSFAGPAFRFSLGPVQSWAGSVFQW